MTAPDAAEPYLRADLSGPYDAVVIGSGMGGLSAAALLGKYGGKHVLVLERHYTPGGYTHTFRRPGYEWDVGVHYIGDVQPGTALRALFDDITGGELQWADMGPIYDRVVMGDEAYEFPAGRENLRAALTARFPAERAAIDTYLDLVERSAASMESFFKAKALPAPLAALAGPFLRRAFLGFARRTTRQVLESLTANQRLIGVLTAQFVDYGLPPAESSFAAHAAIAHHYLAGGFYPIGGAGRIAATIIPVIRAAGGTVVTAAQVAEIVVERGRARGVRMARDGAIIRAPIVVSDAGATNTFTRLVPAETRGALGFDRAARPLQPSLAHLCLYIGLTRTARELALPRANLWIYPDEHHERNLAAAIDDPEARPPFVYVSFPSAKDPDFERRHPGRATIDVITLAGYEHFAGWQGTRWRRRGGDYQALKERLARRLLDILCAHLPQVRPHVDVYELSTPLTTRHFCNYAAGEMYGLAHTPARFRQPSLRPRTALPGLYLTGQDIVTCGVAGALIGGVLCASAILQRGLMRRIVGARPIATPQQAGDDAGHVMT